MKSLKHFSNERLGSLKEYLTESYDEKGTRKSLSSKGSQDKALVERLQSFRELCLTEISVLKKQRRKKK